MRSILEHALAQRVVLYSISWTWVGAGPLGRDRASE
jgi:hypothetical protein